MTSIRLALAAALLTSASLTAAMAQPANNNAQAGVNDVGQNAATSVQTQSANPADSNVQVAMNTTTSTNSSTGISSDASTTQVKESKLRGSAAKKKSFDEQAETTKELNQQAAQLARAD